MFDPLTAIAAITTLLKIGGPIASLAVQQLALLRQQGHVTQEQFDAARHEGQLSDEAWDAALRDSSSESAEQPPIGD